jgi:sulfur-oxidizing protein SoxY
MKVNRRVVLKTAGMAGTAGAASALPLAAFAQAAAAGTWNKPAFDTKSFADTVKAFGGANAELSKDIAVTGPDIAENGAVVPIGASSNLPNTSMIAILVEKNPNVLAASFEVFPGTDANVSTRVKMGQSSNVFALAKVGDKFYYATKEVKVTLGGCGG